MVQRMLSTEETAEAVPVSLRKLYVAILERSLRDLERKGEEKRIAITWFRSELDWGRDTKITFTQVVEFLSLSPRSLNLIRSKIKEADK